jgi:hypothetical protein
LKVSPAVPTSAVARPEEKSTPLDFAQFRIKRIAGVFEYPMIEGEIGFTRLKISFGWNSPDRVFAHFNDRQFATLAIDQMRQLEKVLVHWHQNPANQPTESSRGMLEAVSRAASLSEVKRAVVASGAELSDRGTFVSGGEAKALVDSAMTDGKIEGLENAMILVAYHRALEANTTVRSRPTPGPRTRRRPSRRRSRQGHSPGPRRSETSTRPSASWMGLQRIRTRCRGRYRSAHGAACAADKSVHMNCGAVHPSAHTNPQRASTLLIASSR